jgi:hypothetical protein
MFAKRQADSALDQEIAIALNELKSARDDADKYNAAMDRIGRLQKLKSESRLRPLTPDTLLTVTANIFGILWLARYERENVIKARSALGFVMKPRA